MAGNEQVIDSVVDPISNKQVADLTKFLDELDIKMVQTTKTANALNSELQKNSNTFSAYSKNSAAATTATQKQTENVEKVRLAEIKLQQAREKSFDDYEKGLKKQADAQAKAAAAAQKAASPYNQLSKQLDELRQKAKDVGAQFGQNSEEFKKAAKPVQELDAKIKGIDQTLGQSQRNVGNYGNAFSGVLRQYIPFGDSTLKVSENLKTLTGDIGESEAGLGGLSAGFAGFTTGVFVVAIAAAAYYLSQFKSIGEETEAKIGGLKTAFGALGRGLTESIYTKAGPSLQEEYEAGKSNTEAQQALQNQQEVRQIDNATLEARGQYFRELSNDRTKDISDRQKYLKQAQVIEKQILENERGTAAQTIAVALKVGFQLSSLTKKQIDDQKNILIAAAAKGNLQPGQALALDGEKFSAAGFDLYKQGVEQLIAYRKGAQNQIVQIDADANNQELRADLALAKAQEALNKARIQGALQASKVILDDVHSSNSQKLAANSDYVTQSIKLLKLQEQNELEAAGLGSTRGGKDSRAQALNRAAIEQTTQNEISAVLTQGQKTRQDIQKNAIEAELRLGKARVQGIQDEDNLIINNQKSSLQARIDANENYVNKTVSQLVIEERAALRATNLPKNAAKDDATQHNTRLAIEQEFQNQRNQVIETGNKNAEKIQADGIKELTELFKTLDDSAIDTLQDGLNQRVRDIEKAASNSIDIETDRYTKGIINEKQYNERIKLITDVANRDKIAKELKTAKTILDAQSALFVLSGITGLPVGGNITTKDIEANKGKVSDLESAFTKAQDAVKIDKGKLNDNLTGKAGTAAAIGDAQQLQEDGSRLLQQEYQHEIDLLEQKKQLIEDSAKSEIDAVNSSIASEKTKQNQINVINAHTAQQEAQIAVQEQKIKEKQAKYDRALAIANIIENTAVGATKATGTIFGISLVPIIIALGAAELATVLATPLPSFADGGTASGWSLWGEAGVEAAKEPGKDPYLSTGPQIKNFPTGTRIYSNAELMAMNAPVKVDYTGAEQIGWRELKQSIDALNKPTERRRKQPINIILDSAHESYRRKYFK